MNFFKKSGKDKAEPSKAELALLNSNNWEEEIQEDRKSDV